MIILDAILWIELEQRGIRKSWKFCRGLSFFLKFEIDSGELDT